MEKELWGVSLQPEGQARVPALDKPEIYLEKGPTSNYQEALKLARKKAMNLRAHSPGDENLKPEDLLVELDPEKYNYLIYRGRKSSIPVAFK